MINLPDYTIEVRDGEHPVSNSYHGYSNSDKNKKPLLFKILKDLYNTPENIARFKSVYGKLMDIKSDRIIKILDIQNSNEGIVLIREDFNGIPLKEFLKEEEIDLKTFLSMVIQLSEALKEIHAYNIYHGNISLSSIFIDKENSSIKMGDFELSFLEAKELESFYDKDVIENRLPFISPEQTGRMNRSVDYRTDFYSLGVVFYAMLTGILPFSSRDPLELIHAHIAGIPEVPREVKQDIPEMVSAIVMKLLSKGAEERYQSAGGLKADLEECGRQLNEKGKIEKFPLGKKDISDKFNIPEKLYGREKEIEALQAAFERAASGACEIMLVTGNPGIGKSALVNEIHKTIAAKRSFFIAGQYEQFKRDVPYSAIIQAFQGLVKQILGQSDENLRVYKERLANALGNIGKVITDIIPEVELIVGAQPDVPELGPDGSQNRFNLVFRNFTSVFAAEESPLVLFLDDLQWADSASLKLIKTLTTQRENISLLFIGTYRDNEINESHPMIITFDEIRKRGVVINTISLPPLTQEDVNALTASTLRTDEKMTMPLGEHIYNKTNGNPFFVNQFLKTLYDERVIKFDYESGWKWDIGKAAQMQVTDNVVELMAGKISKLPENTRRILQVCSCMGNRFDLAMLSLVSDIPIEKAFVYLAAAIEEGLVSLQGGIYNFQHDRIQAAAYSLIPDEEKSKIHYMIGRKVLAAAADEKLLDMIFYIVNQLNNGRTMITDRAERTELARLNRMAGIKAKKSTAYGSAVRYLTTGIELLPEQSWDVEYELTFSLFRERMECEYLTGNFEVAVSLFDIVTKNAKTVVDQTNAYTIMVVLYTNIGDYKEAIRLGLEGFDMVGHHIPKKPGKIHVLLELIRLRLNFGRRRIEDIINLSRDTDPERIAIGDLSFSTGTAAYYVDPNLWTVTIIKLINMMLKKGNVEVSSLAWVALGPIIGSGLGFYNEGYRFARAALELNEKLNTPKNRCTLNFLTGYFILHWTRQAREDIQYLRDAYKYGLESGDMIYCGHSINVLCMYRIMIGDNLDDIFTEYKNYKNFQLGVKDPFVASNYHENTQMYLNFKGLTERSNTLNSGGYNEENELIKYRAANNLLGVFYHLLVRMRIQFFIGNYTRCIGIAKEMEKIIEIAIGTLHVAEFYFYYSLALTAGYNSVSAGKRRSHIRQLAKNQKKIRTWAKFCPENFLHKYLLVEAELAVIQGQLKKAKNLYGQAIQSARENGYKQNEAIANERASLLMQRTGDMENMKKYMVEARFCYIKWGATAKVKDLEEKYPHLLMEEAKGAVPSLMSLDFAAVLKASQSISQEIEREKLLNNLMNIVIESAGAQKGFLILEHDENLFIEAEGLLGKEKGGFQAVPVSESQGLSPAIIQYVKRTKENIVLRDASQEGLFVSDSYISKNQIKSVLCTPVFRQSELVCILYLENNLLTDAFTPERLEVLNILSSQAAISLENARLYDGMRKLNEELDLRVKERTAELLNANKKLERSNAELEQFAYIASHDLREPLRKINTFGEMLKKKYYSTLEEEGSGYVDRMQNATVRMQALIDDLLTYSRVTTQAKPYTSVDLNLAVKDVLSDLELRIKKTSGRVEAGPLPIIEADLIQMMQLFQNLIANAVKFHKPDEPPVIKIYALKEAPEGHCMLAVEDNGIGIDEKDYDKIFKMFQRLHGKDEYEGNGIGLAVCKKIVERHKGSIRIESVPGKGTKFIILLPVNPN